MGGQRDKETRGQGDRGNLTHRASSRQVPQLTAIPCLTSSAYLRPTSPRITTCLPISLSPCPLVPLSPCPLVTVSPCHRVSSYPISPHTSRASSAPSGLRSTNPRMLGGVCPGPACSGQDGQPENEESGVSLVAVRIGIDAPVFPGRCTCCEVACAIWPPMQGRRRHWPGVLREHGKNGENTKGRIDASRAVNDASDRSRLGRADGHP